MIRTVWRNLEHLLPTRSRLSIGVLAFESLISGLLEAALLVLVVGVALTVARGGDSVQTGVGVVGSRSLAAPTALTLAAIAGVVMLALHIHISRMSARLSAEVLRAARASAITAYADASWARQAEDREGALQETVSSLATQTSLLVVQLTAMAATSMGLFALLLSAVLVNAVVTLVVLLFGAMLFFALRPMSRLTQRRARVFVDQNSALTEQVSQWSALAMDLRVFGVEESETQRLAELNGTTTNALAVARFVGRAGADLYKDLTILFLVGAVAGLYILGNVEPAAVSAVVLLILRSVSYAQQTNTSLQQIVELSPNVESLNGRLASLRSVPEPVGVRPLDDVTSVELDNVSYDYEPGRPGLRGVTLDIAPGAAIGVIGPSGGGKSTLVQVLLRLRPPTTGTVRISGIPYQEIEPACWHRLISLVPQEPRLFQGTIADNISFFRPAVTAERIEKAAEEAHVLDDIRRLPHGFATELGPRGAGLSGGQKQRIAIARALLGQPQILVLDEPTSALDVHSEQLLQRTISELKGRVTLVIVAHRLTTLACCDRIVSMEQGRTKIFGTLDEALAEVAFQEGEPMVSEHEP